ncbi:hypothetical protein BGLA2_210021 [Burkholderia gladioli]|nr:hypothetical protein BGLA2_210021 [Burkholderia gladioli]
MFFATLQIISARYMREMLND